MIKKQYEDELNDQKPRLLKLQEEIRSIKEQRKILDEQEFNIWRGIFGKEKIVKEKAAELQKIKKGARDEVSCFSFHPIESYIAVGVNNNKQNNQIIMYRFKIEPSSSVNLYSCLPLTMRCGVACAIPPCFLHKGHGFLCFINGSMQSL